MVCIMAVHLIIWNIPTGIYRRLVVPRLYCEISQDKTSRSWHLPKVNKGLQYEQLQPRTLVIIRPLHQQSHSRWLNQCRRCRHYRRTDRTGSRLRQARIGCLPINRQRSNPSRNKTQRTFRSTAPVVHPALPLLRILDPPQSSFRLQANVSLHRRGQWRSTNLGN